MKYKLPRLRCLNRVHFFDTKSSFATVTEDMKEKLISNVKVKQLQCRGGGALPYPSENGVGGWGGVGGGGCALCLFPKSYLRNFSKIVERVYV